MEIQNINWYQGMEWKFIFEYENMCYCAYLDGWLVFGVTVN